MDEPRFASDYDDRQVEAAHRALIDVHQVLGSYSDCLVLVGGWVPDLRLPDAEEPHVGSVDVDLGMDAAKLGDGRYADLLKLLLDTRRYRLGGKPFTLVVDVDLEDGLPAIPVNIDFLAPQDIKLKKNSPKLLKGFRVLRADGCDAAFVDPTPFQLRGKMVRGAENSVNVQVASFPAFLIMKSHALKGRDKPKDAYDICYCLENHPDGPDGVAERCRTFGAPAFLEPAMAILREKFASVDAYGPRQVAEFHQAISREERELQARTAYELVTRFF